MSKPPIVFPYGVRFREGGAIDLFPMASLFLQTRESEWAQLAFIIDSGAAVSAFPKDDAVVLGINLEAGASVMIYGLGEHPISGWKHIVKGRIGARIIDFPAVFFDSGSAPRVLGREGIFEYFTVVFEEHKRRTGFLERTSNEAHHIQRLLDRE